MSKRNDWLDVHQVQEQIEIAGDMVAASARAGFVDAMRGMLPLPGCSPVESPLEAMFWVWWHAHQDGCIEGSNGSYLALECQREVVAMGQRYRLDFVVKLQDEKLAREAAEAGAAFPLIAVEVDGHGFHEKTPEQVALRNTRDRALQQEGWLIFHFSWSEIVTNGANCVGEVLDVAVAALTRSRRAALDAWAKQNPDVFTRAIEAMDKAKGTE